MVKDLSICVRNIKLERISWITDSPMQWLVPLSDTPTYELIVLCLKSLVRHFEIPSVQNPKNKIKLVLEAELAARPVIKAAHSFP